MASRVARRLVSLWDWRGRIDANNGSEHSRGQTEDQ